LSAKIAACGSSYTGNWYSPGRRCRRLRSFEFIFRGATKGSAQKERLRLARFIVVRGFIPVALRSSAETCNCIVPGSPRRLSLRLLRSRMGRCGVPINPLTTEAHHQSGKVFHPSGKLEITGGFRSSCRPAPNPKPRACPCCAWQCSRRSSPAYGKGLRGFLQCPGCRGS